MRKTENMIWSIQQPSELPHPEPATDDHRFGEYTLEYFIVDNFWYIVIVLFMLLVVIFFAWDRNRKRKKAFDEMGKTKT